HRRDQRRPAADLFLRLRFRHTFAPRQLVIIEPRLAIARIIENVDDFAVVAELQTQPELGDAGRDDVDATDQYRTHDAFVDRGLRSAQHALVFAFRVHDAFRRAFRRGEHGLHRGSRLIHEPAQQIAIGIEVLDRTTGD